MAKVNCDVQISVTGPTASGKSLLINRILKAIQSDQGLKNICKLSPSRTFEGIGQDMTGLRFQGELAPLGSKTEIPKIQVYFCHDMQDAWYCAEFPDGYKVNRNTWRDLKEYCLTRCPNSEFEWAKQNGKNYDMYRPKELFVVNEEPKTETVTVNVFDKRPLNADEILEYMRSIISETKLANDPSEDLTEARKLLDFASLTMASHLTVHDSPRKEIIEFLERTDSGARPQSDAPADPVGSHQQSENAAPTMDSGPSGLHRGGYLSRCVMIQPGEPEIYVAPGKKFGRLPGESNADYYQRYRDSCSFIELSKEEIKSGLDRVRWAEGLIRQLPSNHEGRNSWLKNYGQMSEEYAKDFIRNIEACKDAASPVKDAHTTDDPLHAVMMRLGCFLESERERFKANLGEQFLEGIHPKDIVQTITKDGNVQQRVAGECDWSLMNHNPVIFYRVI